MAFAVVAAEEVLGDLQPVGSVKTPMPPPPLRRRSVDVVVVDPDVGVFVALELVGARDRLPLAVDELRQHDRGVPRRMPPPKNPWLLWILLLLMTRFWTYPLTSIALPCTAPVNRNPSICDGFVRNRTLSDRTRIPAPCSRKKSARSPGTARTVPAPADVDLRGPGRLRVGGEEAGVDRRRPGAVPLETERLPEDQVLLVDAGRTRTRSPGFAVSITDWIVWPPPTRVTPPPTWTVIPITVGRPLSPRVTIN